MTSKIIQDLTDLLNASHEEWVKKGKVPSFEEYALPIVGMNLAMQYSPEEVAVAVRDVKVRKLLQFYILETGTKQ